MSFLSNLQTLSKYGSLNWNMLYESREYETVDELLDAVLILILMEYAL